MLEHRFPHLLGGLNRDVDNSARWREGGGAGDEDDPGAPPEGGQRQRVTHFPGGAVGEIADRVQRLSSGAGGDQESLRRQILHRGQEALDRFHDRLDLRKATGSGESRGERTDLRLHHADPPAPERGDVGPDGRVLPHSPVHGRDHQHRRPSGQEHGGEEIVGDPVSRFGQKVGCGRGHHEAVGALGDGDVLHGQVGLRVEEIHEHRPSRQRPPGEIAHEFSGVLGERHRHPRAEARQLAKQIDRLVGRDAPRDPKNDLSTRQHPRDLPQRARASPSSFRR